MCVRASPPFLMCATQNSSGSVRVMCVCFTQLAPINIDVPSRCSTTTTEALNQSQRNDNAKDDNGRISGCGHARVCACVYVLHSRVLYYTMEYTIIYAAVLSTYALCTQSILLPPVHMKMPIVFLYMFWVNVSVCDDDRRRCRRRRGICIYILCGRG